MAENPTSNDANGSARYARSRYWILPSIQGRFIGWLVAVSAIVATTVSLALLIMVWMPLTHQLAWSNIHVQPEELMGSMIAKVLLTTAVLIVVFGLVALAAGLIVSHKVAGPIYRMGVVAAQAGQGQMDRRVTLRRGDYLQEFAARLNAMLDQMEKRFRAQQEALAEAQKTLTDLDAEAAAGRMTPAEMERRIQQTLRALRSGRADDLAEA